MKNLEKQPEIRRGVEPVILMFKLELKGQSHMIGLEKKPHKGLVSINNAFSSEIITLDYNQESRLARQDL